MIQNHLISIFSLYNKVWQSNDLKISLHLFYEFAIDNPQSFHTCYLIIVIHVRKLNFIECFMMINLIKIKIHAEWKRKHFGKTPL